MNSGTKKVGALGDAALRSGDRSAELSVLEDFDTQLMLQVREGNAEAANELVRRNFARVARYVSRVVRDPRAVEDLTQDVFVKVLSHAREFEPRAKLSTWLFRVATNRALNFAKKQHNRRNTRSVGDFGSHELADDTVSAPELALGVDEIRRRVGDALGGLPMNQRAALVLFEYESLSYEQVASVLDVTIESVRCLISRARTALRERLAGLA